MGGVVVDIRSGRGRRRRKDDGEEGALEGGTDAETEAGDRGRGKGSDREMM